MYKRADRHNREHTPGSGSGARVQKDGGELKLICQGARHSPEKVWQALVDRRSE